jgi:hypothetical protein
MHRTSALGVISPQTHSDEGFDTVFQDSLSDEMEGGRWQYLVAGLGANTAQVVRQVTDRLAELVNKRRIVESDARWLLNPLQPLYQTGISAQKLSRFVDWAFHAARESVSLDMVISEAVERRTRTSPRHVFAKDLVPLEVMTDPVMLSGALESLLAWAEGLGTHLHLRLLRKRGPPHGELWLSVTNLSVDAAQDRYLNSLQWYVLWQLARLKGLKVKRKVEDDRIRVIVMFERVVSPDSAVARLEAPEFQEQAPLSDPDAAVVWALLPIPVVQNAVLGSLNRGPMKYPRILKNISELADTSELPHCIVTTAKIIESAAFTYWRQFAQESANRIIVVIDVTTELDVFEAKGGGPNKVVRLSAAQVPVRLVSTIMAELKPLA